MRKITLRNILVFVGIFGTIILVPQIFNSIIRVLGQTLNICIPLRIDLNNWYNIIAIALPSALSYIVVKQSEQQQKENVDLQNRMEEINKKMVELELKSEIGYLRPYFSLKDAGADGSDRQPYPYRLNEYIKLVNSGEHDFFIISANFSVNGNHHVLPCNTPLFISKQLPYNVFCMETNCLSDELNCTQIDMEIELVLKTVKGFRYKQLLFLGFENTHKIGIVNKFNFEIQEVN